MPYAGAFMYVILVNPRNDHFKNNYLWCGCHINFTDEENVARKNKQIISKKQCQNLESSGNF